jgi:hypothetical protein
LLPIQITCVFEKFILRPDIFLNHSNSKSVSFNDSSDPSKITDVGINFDVDISKITKINYEKYFKKMKGLFKQWNKRNLTPIGKITVVKSLILPVLNHLFIALPNPSIEIIKDIEAMLYTFIWKSSVNRVKKDIMQKKYQEGGLKMINFS